MSSTISARRSSSRNATLHNPITGCDCPADAATASCAFCSTRAQCNRATRSRGRNGQSAAALSTNSMPGRLVAAQSSAARMPASGPGKSFTVSAMTGRPKEANLAGSPFAFRISPSHCGSRRAITRSRMVRPAIWRIGLSPPPMRRARPPASNTPGVGGTSVFTAFALSLMPCGFLFDVFQVLVVDDALLTRQRDESLAARASDQCQSNLPRKINAPSGETRARNEDRNAHPYRLDDHLRGEPSRGVKDLVSRIDVVVINPACNLVDGIMATNIFRVADGRTFLAKHTAVDRASFEIKRWHRVDHIGHLIKPGGVQLGFRKRNAFERFKQIAERCALRTARSLRSLLQLRFEIRVMLRAHHDNL